MSEYKTTLEWKRTSPGFSYNEYNRSHMIKFEGGSSLETSSSPEYKGDASLANPEEYLTAALSSCHMLSFLALACKKKLVVDSYTDDAVATLAKNGAGKIAITQTILHPAVTFSGEIPPNDVVMELHHRAHEACFIASSVNFPVLVEAK